MPTLSVLVVSLTIVPSSVQPAAVPIDDQDSVPDPLVVRTVEDDPSALGQVYVTPLKAVVPVTASVEDRVVAPDTVNVPDKDMESFKDNVIDEPSVTSPPPERLVPVETVTFGLDKAELGMDLKVLSEPESVLFVKVWVVSVPTRVVVASGTVTTLAAVGVQVRVPVEPPD